MRVLSIITSSTFLFFLQEIISAWFLFDFFVARESSTYHAINRQRNHTSQSNPNHNAIQDKISQLKKRHCQTHPVPVEKVILIVIDALGSDFIPSLGDSQTSMQATMPFVESLIKGSKALGLTAEAATPTVTMPRLKALIAGSTPSFVDILYNLSQNLSIASNRDDNFLKIAKSAGKSIVFYGDDTWLSLVGREIFLRSRETLSLFATDFTTVDQNVTEMAIPETERETIDWDFMILHYLGLDHIGHSFGSNRHKMIYKKLIEMDDTIKQIFVNMSRKKDKTLIIICGDHGMSYEGNHGGDGDLEKNTAMIFIPVNIPGYHVPKTVSKESVLQIDLATTLCYLTGLRTPNLSMGIPIRSLIETIHSSPDDKAIDMMLCVAVDNLGHMAQFIHSGSYSSEADIDAQYREIMALLDADIISESTVSEKRNFVTKYLNVTRHIQDKSISTIVEKTNPLLISLIMIVSILLTLWNLKKSYLKLLGPLMFPREKLLCLISLGIPIFLQASTDYIESEHHFWPIYSLIVFMALLSNCLGERHSNKLSKIIEKLDKPRTLIFFFAYLLNCSWKTFGIQDGTFETGIASALSLIIYCNFTRNNTNLKEKYPALVSGIVYSFGLILFYTKMEESQNEQGLSTISLALLQVICLLMLVILSSVSLGSLCMGGECQAAEVVQKMSLNWMWLALLLARPRNFVYLVSNVILEVSVNSVADTFQLSIVSRCLVYSYFSLSSFYNQGNTNLFTSIDVKPAFFGQESYSLLLASPLVAIATYSSQIYWYIKLFQRVQADDKQKSMTLNSQADLRSGVRDFIDMCNYLTLVFYMFVCLVLRNHLFVWSVVSPKLVYSWMGSMTVLRIATLTVSNLPSLLGILNSRIANYAKARGPKLIV